MDTVPDYSEDMPDTPYSARRPLQAAFYSEDRLLACCLIRRGRYIVGHDPKNEIVLDEPSISGTHARLSVHSDDEIYIEDLGSANGTFVNGRRLAPQTPTAIEQGDELKCGTLLIRVEFH